MLSSTAEYALRIMIALTESKGDPLTGDAISSITKVPEGYTFKVLGWLSRAKLVWGQRGRGGGFQLACDPETTSLLDVVNAIDPLERITACPLGRKMHRSLCPLHSRLDEILGLLEESLDEMTLQSIVDGAAGPALCRPKVSMRVSAKGGRRGKK